MVAGTLERGGKKEYLNKKKKKKERNLFFVRDDSGKREIVFKEKEKIDCANDVGGGKRVPHMRGIFFSFQSFFEQLLFAYFA